MKSSDSSANDDSLVRLACPHCDQHIAFPQDNPAVDIQCPQCGIAILLSRSESGEIVGITHKAEAKPSRFAAVLRAYRPQKRHAGPLFTLLVFLGIYFFGAPWLTFRWALKKAERGDTAAQMEVALRYETGNGPWRDYEQAIWWYSEAANNGELHALFLIHGALASTKQPSDPRITIHDKYGREGLVFLAAALSGPDTVRKLFGNFRRDPLAERFLRKHAAAGSAIASIQLAIDNPFGGSCLPSESSKTVTDGPLPKFFHGYGKEPPFEAGTPARAAADSVHKAFRQVVEDNE